MFRLLILALWVLVYPVFPQHHPDGRGTADIRRYQDEDKPRTGFFESLETSLHDASLNILSPLNGSTVECEASGAIRAMTQLSVDIYLSDEFASMHPVGDLELHITMNPESMSANYMGAVPIQSIATGTQMLLESILPGNRGVGVTLEDTRTGVIYAHSISFFHVICSSVGEGDDEDIVGMHRTSENEQTVDFSLLTNSNYDPDEFDRGLYFDQIYRYDFWRDNFEYADAINEQRDPNYSSSGPGSSKHGAMGAWTALKEIIAQPDVYGIRRIIDVPCGDMTWLNVSYLLAQNVSYVGIDVSKRVIKQNIARYKHLGALNRQQPHGDGDGEERAAPTATTTAAAATGTGTGTSSSNSNSNEKTPLIKTTGEFGRQPSHNAATGQPVLQFLHGDLASEAFQLTLSPHDLLLCRHLMFHLPARDNMHILNKISQSGASWTLLTTYLRADDNNREFVFGLGHLVNLFRPPYCVRDPVRLYLDGLHGDMFLGLWDLQLHEESSPLAYVQDEGIKNRIESSHTSTTNVDNDNSTDSTNGEQQGKRLGLINIDGCLT